MIFFTHMMTVFMIMSVDKLEINGEELTIMVMYLKFSQRII